MSTKKIVMSVTAGAAIATFAATEQAEASESYTVKQGDSLWKIAQEHNMTVNQLKALNNLNTNIIHPNQVLVTKKNSTSSNSNSSSSNPKPSQPNGTTKTYTVKSGDTLSEIAFKHNISLANLMKWNGLETTLIFPGNKFVVENPGKDSSSSSGNSNNSSNTSNGNHSGNTTDSSGSSNTSKQSTTYTVVAGDSLSVIGQKYGVSVANLKRWNNLNSDLIRVGQILYIEGTAKPSNNSDKNNSNDSSAKEVTTYTVKSGDSLSKIASQYKVTVAQLKSWNNLRSDTIYIGQKLSINGQASSNSKNNGSEKTPEDVSYNVDKLLNAAQSMLGVKYVWGGQTAAGFDCSGFIHFAYNKAGMKSSRTSTDVYFNRFYYVDQPKIVNLVFFKNTYRSGISHMGIYIGNNEFIHAGTSTGVTIANLNNSYWKKHFDSFKRFY